MLVILESAIVGGEAGIYLGERCQVHIIVCLRYLFPGNEENEEDHWALGQNS